MTGVPLHRAYPEDYISQDATDHPHSSQLCLGMGWMAELLKSSLSEGGETRTYARVNIETPPKFFWWNMQSLNTVPGGGQPIGKQRAPPRHRDGGGNRQTGKLPVEWGVSLKPAAVTAPISNAQPIQHTGKKKNTRALSIAQQHYLNRSKRNVLNPEFKLQKKNKK